VKPFKPHDRGSRRRCDMEGEAMKRARSRTQQSIDFEQSLLFVAIEDLARLTPRQLMNRQDDDIRVRLTRHCYRIADLIRAETIRRRAGERPPAVPHRTTLTCASPAGRHSGKVASGVDGRPNHGEAGGRWRCSWIHPPHDERRRDRSRCKDNVRTTPRQCQRIRELSPQPAVKSSTPLAYLLLVHKNYELRE